MTTKREADYSHMVGKRVSKISGKPFKSKLTVNIVKAVVKSDRNPNAPGIDWFEFIEDDSQVEAWRCVEV